MLRGAGPAGCLAGVGLLRGVQNNLPALVFSFSGFVASSEKTIRIMPTSTGQWRSQPSANQAQMRGVGEQSA